MKPVEPSLNFGRNLGHKNISRISFFSFNVSDRCVGLKELFSAPTMIKCSIRQEVVNKVWRLRQISQPVKSQKEAQVLSPKTTTIQHESDKADNVWLAP